jgi:hypothetical protein
MEQNADVEWDHAPLVSIDGDGRRIRRDRHTVHAGIAGLEMGLRSADRLYRPNRGFPARPRMSGTAAGAP